MSNHYLKLRNFCLMNIKDTKEHPLNFLKYIIFFLNTKIWSIKFVNLVFAIKTLETFLFLE